MSPLVSSGRDSPEPGRSKSHSDPNRRQSRRRTDNSPSGNRTRAQSNSPAPAAYSDPRAARYGSTARSGSIVGRVDSPDAMLRARSKSLGTSKSEEQLKNKHDEQNDKKKKKGSLFGFGRSKSGENVPQQSNGDARQPRANSVAAGRNRTTSDSPDRNGEYMHRPSVGAGAWLTAGNQYPDDPDDEDLNPQSKPSFNLNPFKRQSLAQPSMPVPPPIPDDVEIPRPVFNIDNDRDRCVVQELDSSKLRRVAFSVDVEIAGHSHYAPQEPENGEPMNDEEKQRQAKVKKMKEKAEGEALKKPVEMKEEVDQPPPEARPPGEDPKAGAPDPRNGAPRAPDGAKMKDDVGRKESIMPPPGGMNEAQRQLSAHGGSPSQSPSSSRRSSRVEQLKQTISNASNGSSSQKSNAPPQQPQKRGGDRPTMDPLRIYRRCCQLREAPVLKRISEQLAAFNKSKTENMDYVPTLNLSRSRMQLQDIACVADWFALVPVKKVLLDDANLNDEGVRLILGGLLAARPAELAAKRRYRNVHARITDLKDTRSAGVVEKLTLKHNPKITKEGWKHISLFINMCRSIKALDLSQVPFPGTDSKNGQETQYIADILFRSLSQRLAGNKLSELIFGGCGLTTYAVGKITSACSVIRCKVLGLADNKLDRQALEHVIRYVKSGECRGLDLGGNDLRKNLDIVTTTLDEKNPLWAISVANCNLDSESLSPFFPALISMPDLRFLDLSSNKELFGSTKPVMHALRKYLPQMIHLKRLHLMNVSLTPAQAIGLADIIPEIPHLAHLNIMENPELTKLANSKSTSDQEEACAFYAAMMTAAKASNTLIALDMEMPSRDSPEIVKAVARQVMAHCLQNMEKFAATDGVKVPGTGTSLTDVIHAEKGRQDSMSVDNYNRENIDVDPLIFDNASQKEDYLVGGTGVAKALQYCLTASHYRKLSLTDPEGPVQMVNSEAGKQKARDMSKSLLDSARRIRTRMQPVLESEASVGDENSLKRLQFLDQTLKSMINRFEEEYPEVRDLPVNIDGNDVNFRNSNGTDLSSNSHEDPHTGGEIEDEAIEFVNGVPTAPLHGQPGKRRGSSTSEMNRPIEDEEGMTHRFGQQFRRKILPPAYSTDHLHGTNADGPEEAEHLAALRSEIQEINSEEIRDMLRSKGLEGTLKEFHRSKQRWQNLKENNPDDFERMRRAQKVMESKGPWGRIWSQEPDGVPRSV